jgi:phenylacetate-CoA ligase
MIVGPEGQLLAGEFFPHLLKDYSDVARFQVHQAKDRAITLRLVPGEGYTEATAQRIEAKVREFLGAHASLKIEIHADIPVTRGGKFRVAVSEVPIDLGAPP